MVSDERKQQLVELTQKVIDLKNEKKKFNKDQNGLIKSIELEIAALVVE